MWDVWDNRGHTFGARLKYPSLAYVKGTFQSDHSRDPLAFTQEGRIAFPQIPLDAFSWVRSLMQKVTV